MKATIRTIIDVLAYGAMCFAGGIVVTSWWRLGPRRKK